MIVEKICRKVLNACFNLTTMSCQATMILQIVFALIQSFLPNYDDYSDKMY